MVTLSEFRSAVAMKLTGIPEEKIVAAYAQFQASMPMSSVWRELTGTESMRHGLELLHHAYRNKRI